MAATWYCAKDKVNSEERPADPLEAIKILKQQNRRQILTAGRQHVVFLS